MNQSAQRGGAFLLAIIVVIALLLGARHASRPVPEGGETVEALPVARATGDSARSATPALAVTRIEPLIVRGVLPAPDSAQTQGRRDVAMVSALAPRASGDVRVLDAAMAIQPRDPARASPTEALLTGLIGALPGLGGSVDGLHVACADMTCEVTGRLADPRAAAPLQAALRDPVRMDPLVRAGYMPGPITVGPVARAGAGGTGFLLYLTRET